MIVRTTNGLMDVDERIGSNLSFQALTSMPANAGNLQEPGVANQNQYAVSSSVVAVIPWGEWFEIDPSNVVFQRVVPFIFQPYWKLPDGSEIKLEDSYSAVSTLGGLFTWSCSSARVKLVPQTLAGLKAYGHVRNEIDPSTLPDQGRVDGNQPATIPDAIVKGSSALIIVALVGAAIWFLPKNLARG